MPGLMSSMAPFPEHGEIRVSGRLANSAEWPVLDAFIWKTAKAP